MLGKHQEPYGVFYRSTHDNEHLDTKTELLVGLSAAMAMNCLPCARYYLHEAKKAGITKGEISDVTAKVMADCRWGSKAQMELMMFPIEVFIAYTLHSVLLVR